MAIYPWKNARTSMRVSRARNSPSNPALREESTGGEEVVEIGDDYAHHGASRLY